MKHIMLLSTLILTSCASMDNISINKDAKVGMKVDVLNGAIFCTVDGKKAFGFSVHDGVKSLIRSPNKDYECK
jgi:hypothetical protein